MNPAEHPYIQKLVELYATYPVARIETEPDLSEKVMDRSLEELSLDNDFKKYNNFVKKLRGSIDEPLQRERLDQAIDDESVAECLYCLLTTALFDREPPFELKMGTLRSLLAKIYGKNWSTPQQQHFDFWFERLKSWNSFFLSYTNRDVTQINHEYEEVIRYFLPANMLEALKWDSDNLLAETLVHQLKKENLMNGFYDKTNITHGDDLKEKIGQACDTFVFLQLAHKETFAASQDNWCFMEFTIFSDKNSKLLSDIVKRYSPVVQDANQLQYKYRDVLLTRFRAAVAGDDPVPKLLPPKYEPWGVQVMSKHHIKLSTKTKDFQDAVGKIADAIVTLQRKLMRSVPNSGTPTHTSSGCRNFHL